MHTVKLKIQQLISSVSSAGHMVVTVFYSTIIPVITTAILLGLYRTINHKQRNYVQTAEIPQNSSEGLIISIFFF